VTARPGAADAQSSAGRAGETELVLATYNIHRFVGRDGRYDPIRVVRVIHELQADVVALQEFVFAGTRLVPGSTEQLFAGLEGYEFVTGTMRVRRGQLFGNALLARGRVREVRRLDLTVPPREARGALDVSLEARGISLRILATHLGLYPRERRVQWERLLEHVSGVDDGLFAVLGDFNEWRNGEPAISAMERSVGETLPLRSFPTPRPLLALDRIWVRPAAWLSGVRVHRSALAARASDHFPVVASVRVDPRHPPDR
jgi:endonuclease/exonuclease/phosphatase family metal-dependent hydrolase